MDDLHYTAGAPRPAALSLLDRYESIAVTSRAMVAAARIQDWVEVQRLEQLCIEQVQHLKAAAQLQALKPDDQATRLRLLRSILADDAEIRRLAEPWLAELEHLLLPQRRVSPQRPEPEQ